MSRANKEPEAEGGRPPKKQPDEDEEGLEREAYLEERKTLVEAEGEASQSLDKALITLSAGAFGLSLLFIYRIAPDPQALQRCSKQLSEHYATVISRIVHRYPLASDRVPIWIIANSSVELHNAIGRLYIAWGGFVLSLVSILSSFLVSQQAFRKAREILDSDYKDVTGNQVNNHWSTATSWLTTLSIVSFICGVVASASFAIRNLA